MSNLRNLRKILYIIGLVFITSTALNGLHHPPEWVITSLCLTVAGMVGYKIGADDNRAEAEDGFAAAEEVLARVEDVLADITPLPEHVLEAAYAVAVREGMEQLLQQTARAHLRFVQNAFADEGIWSDRLLAGDDDGGYQ